jgi:hypothetical protein
MRKLISYLILLTGWALGWALHASGIMQHPAWFFKLGAITGVISAAVGMKYYGP